MSQVVQPFSPRAVLALIAAGAAAFLVLLYAIGTGFAGGGGNDGGGHALSKGLAGYAGLAALLEGSGFETSVSRDPRALDAPGLVVLTPPHETDGDELAAIVEARRYLGPTLVVLPKWRALPLGIAGGDAKPGWVTLVASDTPEWLQSIDETLAARIANQRGGTAGWRGGGRSGRLPRPDAVQALASGPGEGKAVLALVSDRNGRTIAGYLNDTGDYALLDAWSGFEPVEDPDVGLFPVVIVAEPDLLNNYGLADRNTADNALALIRAAGGERAGPIAFDVTLNGLGRARNLLTLAFTPPFLAATLCLLLAALAVGWRSFARFGPPRRAGRAIAFGKTALVENSAGLIRRAGRIHLLGSPYALLVAARLRQALGLPASADLDAFDAVQSRRGIAGPSFSRAFSALAAARKPHDLVRRAAVLRAIEKALTT